MLKGGVTKAFEIVLTQTLEVLAILVMVAGGGGGCTNCFHHLKGGM